ncbi:MAG: SBBP repeat-containing protein, partial [Ignavibacteria bacterium]|nr:SBBP repeat-containing protein [Ignavibacteria bacterium]
MKKLILILMLFSCYDAINSQVVQEWAKRYNGPAGTGNDAEKDMVVDASGNTYVTGDIVISESPYRKAIATVKYDPNGTRIWVARFAPSDTCIYNVLTIAADVSGNVYIAGFRYGITSGVLSGQGIVVKYNAAGLQEWVKYPSGLKSISNISIDQSGNVLVVGESSGRFVAIKYSSSGTQTWMQTYNVDIDRISDLLIDASGYGYIFGDSRTNGDFFTIKINSSGTLQWLKAYSIGKHAGKMSLDGSGNVYVTGYSSRDGLSNNVQDSITTIKYTSSGSVAWIRSVIGVDIYRGGYPDCQVKTDAAGNVYVAGLRDNLSNGNVESVLLKYNSSGTLQWSQATTEFAYSMIVDASGTIFFAGTQAIVKYNTTGVQQWFRNYNGAPYLDKVKLKLDNTGNVIVASSTLSTSSGLDFTTVKYSSAGLFQWNTTYQGTGSDYDEARSMVVDNSGYTVVSGIVTGISSGKDMGVVRYTPSGVQWTRTHNGTANGDDKVNASVVDASGNIYVTGVAVNTTSGADYATIKYNSTGVRQWVALYNGTGNGSDEARSIAVDNSGNVYVTGSSRGTAGMDYATVKYNLNGTQQWVQRYNGPLNAADDAYSLALDGSGNVYVTGSCTGNTSGLDYTTVKYNSSGTFQWAAIFNGTGNMSDVASALKTDAAGNVFVTGWSSRTVSDIEYVTIKYNTSGVQQWTGKYNGNGGAEDMAAALALDAAGNVYVTGSSVGLGTSTDYATVKYNAAGIQQWASRYNGPANSGDGARDLAIDALGNIYVTGSSNGTSTSSDFATIKYNSAGTQLWATRYDGPGTGGVDGAVSVAVDAAFKVYVAGLSFGSSSNTYDFAAIKYLQTGTSGRTLNEMPTEFNLTQNYPNPFNPQTMIKFALSVGGVTTLKVYDIAGKEVASMVESDLEAGYHEINFNASELSSGVYFYRLTSGS